MKNHTVQPIGEMCICVARQPKMAVYVVSSKRRAGKTTSSIGAHRFQSHLAKSICKVCVYVCKTIRVTHILQHGGMKKEPSPGEKEKVPRKKGSSDISYEHFVLFGCFA